MVEKIFGKKCVFSLEWKSEGVMDDDSGDSEEDEGEEDWLREGWRSEATFGLRCWANPWRKIAHSLNQSLTQSPAYLMPLEPKLSLRHRSFRFGIIWRLKLG